MPTSKGARPRLRTCVEAWPECETGAHDPRCCRFPKSCSCTAYDEERVSDSDLEPTKGASEAGRRPVSGGDGAWMTWTGGKRASVGGLAAIEKVLRVHSGEEFEADDFPNAEEGRDAWLTWQDVRATVEEAYPDA